MPPGDEKYEAFVEYGMWRRAVEEAAKMKDAAKLQEV
jgi:hypothetical protein